MVGVLVLGSRMVGAGGLSRAIDSSERLRRITEITGYDPTDPREGFVLRTALALGRLATTPVAQIATLEAEVQRCFGQHPDAEIITSQPGLGVVLGARVLAEFGDDKDRFLDAKARRNYAGTSPITKTSGTRRVVLARYARNRRLADAVHQQAFAALNGSPGARAFYDHHRARGATHHQALRALANRLVGILDGCLRHRTNYDEAIAWAHRANVAADELDPWDI
jgi:transposase